ncbi:sigma-70 family RNA polymerase sigma factor [Micromonospora sp. M12]
MVVAARQGDQRALDDVVAASLPLVYNIVGRALRGHADVDDVVQETLVRVIRYLPALNDPAAYRSWLVAIAIRQVRDWEMRRRAALNRDAGLDAIHNVPDPASDFAGMTILRLGLTDQRREVAEATRWLDPDDQELLSLWWLEETGEIARDEVADALGLSPGHVAVRIHRMKEQIQSARGVVRALRARPACPDLRAVTAEWDGTPSSLWRKRLARHVRDCAFCGRLGSTLLPIDRLLAGMPLLPLPAGLTAHFPGAAAPQPPPRQPQRPRQQRHGRCAHGRCAHGRCPGRRALQPERRRPRGEPAPWPRSTPRRWCGRRRPGHHHGGGDPAGRPVRTLLGRSALRGTHCRRPRAPRPRRAPDPRRRHLSHRRSAPRVRASGCGTRRGQSGVGELQGRLVLHLGHPAPGNQHSRV